jgi:hypothetical protein
MPRRDACEPQVIAALNKEGWTLLGQQVYIEISDGSYIFLDLELQRRPSEHLLIVEVKCFPHTDSYQADFYISLGQYAYYRNALRVLGLDKPLYLALPEAAYRTFLQEPAARLCLEEFKVRLIVIDLEQEVIVEWRHY